MATKAQTKNPTAKLIKDNLRGFKGHAALYRLDPPLNGHKRVIVSAVNAFLCGPETYIFAAQSRKAEVKNWTELEGSYRGDLDHARALRKAGYKII